MSQLRQEVEKTMVSVRSVSRRVGSVGPGSRSRWARRRHYIEGGLIKPVPGATARAYNPLVGHPGEVGPLHLELAGLDVRSAAAVEGFASTWGVLGPDQRAQSVEEFMGNAEEFRRVYLTAVCLGEGETSMAHVAWLQTTMAEHIRGCVPIPRITSRAEQGEQPPDASDWELAWELPSLLAGACLLLFLDLKGGKRARLCANEKCDRPFTTDRSDRKYCSARCSDNQKQREIRRRLASLPGDGCTSAA